MIGWAMAYLAHPAKPALTVVIQLSPNCTDKLQPLDISVDKPVKDRMKAKFQQWYTDEVKRKPQTTPINQIKMDINLAIVKNPSAS